MSEFGDEVKSEKHSERVYLVLKNHNFSDLLNCVVDPSIQMDIESLDWFRIWEVNAAWRGWWWFLSTFTFSFRSTAFLEGHSKIFLELNCYQTSKERECKEVAWWAEEMEISDVDNNQNKIECCKMSTKKNWSNFLCLIAWKWAASCARWHTDWATHMFYA